MAALFVILRILLGAVLAVIALLIILLLSVLFVPVSYEADGKIYGEPEAEASVKWLFGLLGFKAGYREKVLSGRLKLFGIPVRVSAGKEKKKTEPGAPAGDNKEAEETEDKRPGFFRRNRELLSEPRTEFALNKALMLIGRMLAHILPRRLEGELTFGMEEPDSTGKILAVLAVLLPLHRNAVKITPDFSRKVLEGRVKLKGRISVIVLLVLALRILLDKNVRFVLKKIRENYRSTEVNNV